MVDVDFANSIVSYIGYRSFYNNKITTVTFNKYLKSVETQAFYSNSISSVNLTASTNLVYISSGAFSTNKLTSLDLSGCSKLTYIYGDTTYGGAFHSNLIKTLKLGNIPLSSFGTYSFYGNSITELDLSGLSQLVSIGTQAFYSNSITNLTLSPKLTAIEAGAFIYNKLKSVDFTVSPYLAYINGDNSPYGGAFESNTLTSVKFGGASSRITWFGTKAFYNNYITSLDLSNMPYLVSIGYYSFYVNDIANLTLSPKLTAIEPGAFRSNNLKLSLIHISEPTRPY